MKITKVQQTCLGCPSQWDAWDENGDYLYLRYRFGTGTVDCHATPVEFEESVPGSGCIIQFEYGHRLDGDISLEKFCELAGLELAEDVEYVSYGEWFRQELKRELDKSE